jgi:hypothetical protein
MRPTKYKTAAERQAANRMYGKRFRKKQQLSLQATLADRLKKAKYRDPQCDITLNYLLELYRATPCCALTHLPFDLTQKRTTISIDRIDSARGYVVGNVRLVRLHVNLALNEWGLDALLEMATELLAVQSANQLHAAACFQN